ncbi:MAG: agmatinase family protein [Phycisphaeraceae bacterium]|nr:agmatinase family protein [Phycisphaeraceae bacterium]
MTFDPDAAAQPGSGIFGLPFKREQSRIVIIPVPFDATTSYGGGTANGPRAVFDASAQVDLHDHQFGAVYRHGIFMERIPRDIAALSARARRLARPIIARGGAISRDRAAIAKVNDACFAVAEHTYDRTRTALDEGRIPGILGGDHSTPFGAIWAAADHVAQIRGNKGLGILQVDAHMDLRDAFEGFAWSHASIMHNVMWLLPRVSRLVQVGIRDYGAGEREASRRSGGRIVTHFDHDWSRRLDAGARFEALCRNALKPLPRHVWVSFDIDGLDPALCPHTGTPVPGGFSFARACVLLELLARSGRTIVGFDLNEVCPGPSKTEPEWDANVGARMLYKLCGAALASRTD